MPVDGCLNAPGLTVDVTKTRSRQTIGEDQPRPGTLTFHATFFVVDQVVGSELMSARPRPDAPRNCGQTASAGTPGAAAERSSNANAVTRRIWGVYPAPAVARGGA